MPLSGRKEGADEEKREGRSIRLRIRIHKERANEEEEGEGADDKEKEGAVGEEYWLEGKERLRYSVAFITLHLARRKCLLLGYISIPVHPHSPQTLDLITTPTPSFIHHSSYDPTILVQFQRPSPDISADI